MTPIAGMNSSPIAGMDKPHRPIRYTADLTTQPDNNTD